MTQDCNFCDLSVNDFVSKQQEIIDREMLEMPAETVNEILADMKPSEANRFLERLGHLRAKAIYDSWRL